jgi:hypothetical protein
MKIRKIFKLTFFMFIISTTLMINSGFSKEITRNQMNSFNDPSGWDVMFWGGKGVTQIVTSDSPDGGSMLKYTFVEGLGDGSEPGNVFFVSPLTLSESYIQFYHKFDTDYNWHPIANKLLYIYSGNSNQTSACFLERYGELWFGPYANNWDGEEYKVSTSRPTKGVWYKYTIYTKMNSSPGVADGLLKIWINDVLKVNSSTVTYFTSGTSVTGWKQFDMAPAYGGGGSSNPSVGHAYYDDFIISTTPISENIIQIVNPTVVSPNSPINLQIK